MSTSVKIENVTKRFGNFVANDHVNLNIEAGDFVSLLGPSGCGKTTLLSMILGVQDITEGKIYFDDTLVSEIPIHKRDVGMVFQNYALFQHMTVEDNVAFGLKMRKLPKEQITSMVTEALEMVHMQDLRKRFPRELSGGQQQRVAFARAIVVKPRVLLLDEPLSNLDAKLRVQMRSEIASLHNRLKATIIYVTHDQTEAMTLGTRIVVLKDGVIMQVDSPQKLYNEPNNLFVAGFIGSPQMNFVDAVCKVEGEKVTLSFENTTVILPPAKAKKLADGGYNGKTVVMGIRPEDIGDSEIEIEAHKDAAFETDVTGYELLGSEVLLYFKVAGASMTAKVDSRTTARMGDHIKMAIDPEKIHVFDKETELTITN